jgi:hypothetical protein
VLPFVRQKRARIFLPKKVKISLLSGLKIRHWHRGMTFALDKTTDNIKLRIKKI